MIEASSKNFALLGLAGYIAERHVRAIRDTNHRLLAALDPCDSVGFIDSYFPEADFFTEFERFDRHVSLLNRRGTKLDYVTICSPNYLHDSHIRFALRNGAGAICEKPVVLNPWNIDALESYEKEVGRRIWTILQLRLYPEIAQLKQRVQSEPSDEPYDVDLAYIASRGNWYQYSWKGQPEKSGGVTTNIGIHFFDMLTWIFGDVRWNTVHTLDAKRAAGYLELERARVRWFLSVDCHDLPARVRDEGKRTYRCIRVNGRELEFSQGFTDLHTTSYRRILSGEGFGLDDARPSIQTVYAIRNASPVGIKGDYHPLLASRA